jgi:hypothetical protein
MTLVVNPPLSFSVVCLLFHQEAGGTHDSELALRHSGSPPSEFAATIIINDLLMLRHFISVDILRERSKWGRVPGRTVTTVVRRIELNCGEDAVRTESPSFE